MRAHRAEAVGRQHRGAARERGLGCVRGRQHQRAPGTCGRKRCGEHPAHRAQAAVQRELAAQLQAGELPLGHLARGGEDADRDREVEAPALLGQVGRRQVYGNAALGKLELRRLDRRTHTIARLAHLGVGEADEVELGQAVAEMDLDRDRRRLDPVERACMHEGERHRRLPGERSRQSSGAAVDDKVLCEPHNRGASGREAYAVFHGGARLSAPNATAPDAASPPCSRLPPLGQKPASPRKPGRSAGSRESGGPGTTQSDEDHRRFRACRRSYMSHHGYGFV